MKVNLKKNEDHYFLSITDYSNQEPENIVGEVKKEMKKCYISGKHLCCPDCGSYIVHNAFSSHYLRNSSIVYKSGQLICDNCIDGDPKKYEKTIKIDMNDPDFENYVPVEIVDLRILPNHENTISCNCS